MLSSDASSKAWSRPTSPNSLTMTAVSAKAGVRHQLRQDRRLAAAKKAGQHGDGDEIAVGHASTRNAYTSRAGASSGGVASMAFAVVATMPK